MAGSPVNGLDEVLNRMATMRLNVQKKYAKKAAKKALKPVKDDAIKNAKLIDDPATAEKIHQNVQIQIGKPKNKDEIIFRVGIKGGAKSKNTKKKGKGGDTFYWRFVELGTSTIPAAPFLRPALAKNINKATVIFITELKQDIAGDLS